MFGILQWFSRLLRNMLYICTVFHNPKNKKNMYQRKLSFSEAVDRALKCNYFNFGGRASLSDFWWFLLFCMLSFVLGVFLGGVLGEAVACAIGVFVSVTLFVPMLSMAVRRLHDVNRSGWWLPFAITGIGLVPLLIWFCSSSHMDMNVYGDIPNMVD